MADEKILSLEEMLEAPDLEYQTVEVPEWKGSVRLGSLDAGTMIEFMEMDALARPGIWLLVHALVDVEGKRIGTPEAVERMKRKNKAVVNRLIAIVMKMNGLGGTQTAAKNASGEAVPAASPTA